MSYSHARSKVRSIARAGGPVVVSARGGKGKGSTRLTEPGHALLGRFKRKDSTLFSRVDSVNQ